MPTLGERSKAERMISSLRQEIALWEDRVLSAEQGVLRAQQRVEQARAEVAELRSELERWEGRG